MALDLATLDWRAKLFFAAELEAYQPGDSVLTFDEGEGVKAEGTLRLLPQSIEETETIRLAEERYVTAPGDDPPQALYEPLLQSALELDRQIDIDPTQEELGAGAAWGSLRAANPGGRWDGLIRSRNLDRRPVTLRLGAKAWDKSRRLHLDPPLTDLLTVFRGVAGAPSLSEEELSVPLFDASSRLERPLQSSLYAGSGGLEGPADLAGTPKPKLRGGTASNPVRNITPRLVDPVNLIYQVSDGGGGIAALAQRGLQGDIAFQGAVADLYSGATNPGEYRTQISAAGTFFQLGSIPEGEITCDAWGSFPAAGAQSGLGAVCHYLMTEEMGLTAEEVDTAAWAALDSELGYQVGIYVDGETEAVTALAQLLNGAGCRMMAARGGLLRPYVLRSPTEAAVAGRYGPGRIVDVQPADLPPSIAVPPWRIRVGSRRNWTVQTQDLAAAVGASRRQWLAEEYRWDAAWSDAAVQGAWREAGDLRIPSLLTRLADAQDVADRLGALYAPAGQRRLAYDVTMALDPLRHDLLEVLMLTFPVAGLSSGGRSLILGEAWRSAEERRVILRVLV